MSGLAQPPAPLQDAIARASAAEHVPSDVLTGIWRIEAGGKFPNPYANGLGYGGEFGTMVTAPFGSASDVHRIVEPPLSEQANLAATILHNQLVAHHGNLAQALESYSGNGYSQVPGETTFGNVDVGQTLLSPPALTPQNPVGAQQAHVQNAGFSASSILDPGGVFEKIWGGIKTPFDLAATVWGFLTSSKTWIRIGLVVGGFIFVVGGVLAIVR